MITLHESLLGFENILKKVDSKYQFEWFFENPPNELPVYRSFTEFSFRGGYFKYHWAFLK